MIKLHHKQPSLVMHLVISLRAFILYFVTTVPIENKCTIHRLFNYVEYNYRNLYTVMILSFRTDMPRQTVLTQIRLIRVYTVCHSICIVLTHFSMVQPHSSNFRVITTNILGVRIFRKFTVILFSSRHQGPVVQSIVSLTKSLVNDSLSLLVRLKSSVLIFFAEKM